MIYLIPEVKKNISQLLTLTVIAYMIIMVYSWTEGMYCSTKNVMTIKMMLGCHLRNNTHKTEVMVW